MFLAGDIGGTKTVLGLFEEAAGDLRPVRVESFASKDHRSLEEILAKFLATEPGRPLRAACFGAAGPVLDGQIKTTNLPWHLDEKKLAQSLRIPRAKLLNDLEATAYGTLFLKAEELFVLRDPARPGRQGNVAVIAAGTGLGEAMLYWDGERHHPLASEGGHADFAPRTDQEIELLRYLRARHGSHVSYERVLSGPGIFSVYSFLRDSGHAPEPPWLAEKIRTEDPNAAVTEAGLAGEKLPRAALELFCSIYGAEAGNMGLRCLALGGVFVAGGIAPRILPVLRQSDFLQSFTAKGRLADLLQTLEVSVALDPQVPLIGAAHYAAR